MCIDMSYPMDVLQPGNGTTESPVKPSQAELPGAKWLPATASAPVDAE